MQNGTQKKTEPRGRIPISLVEEEFSPSEGDLRAEERRLRLVADELSGALDRMRQAVLGLRETPLAADARELFASLERLQEETTRELGRRVGERVAAECRWRVRAGIEVVDREE